MSESPKAYSCPYQTDLGLSDDLIIYRLIPPFDSFARLDGGNLVVSSNAFSEIGATKATSLGYPEPATSIMFHDEIIDAGLTVEEAADIELNAKCGIAMLTIGDVRAIDPEVGVLRDGKPNPWHGILFATTRRKMKAEKNQLRDAIRSIIREPDFD